MKIKNLILAAAASVALTASVATVEAQAYHADGLLSTVPVFWAATFPTNFVQANYFVPTSTSLVVPGSGVFEIKPQAQWPAFASENGISFEMLYLITSPTNAAVSPQAGPGTNYVLTAVFQPILDDATFKLINLVQGPGATATPPTNNLAFSVNFTLYPNATNVGGVYIATAQTAMTNSAGCKYAKLIGMNFTSLGATSGFTNGLLIRSFRAGYAGPLAGPIAQ